MCTLLLDEAGIIPLNPRSTLQYGGLGWAFEVANGAMPFVHLFMHREPRPDRCSGLAKKRRGVLGYTAMTHEAGRTRRTDRDLGLKPGHVPIPRQRLTAWKFGRKAIMARICFRSYLGKVTLVMPKMYCWSLGVPW